MWEARHSISASKILRKVVDLVVSSVLPVFTADFKQLINATSQFSGLFLLDYMNILMSFSKRNHFKCLWPRHYFVNKEHEQELTMFIVLYH